MLPAKKYIAIDNSIRQQFVTIYTNLVYAKNKVKVKNSAF